MCGVRLGSNFPSKRVVGAFCILTEFYVLGIPELCRVWLHKVVCHPIASVFAVKTWEGSGGNVKSLMGRGEY